MSTRTIIEINHDAINALLDVDAFILPRLLVGLRSCLLDEKERDFLAARGIRVLGQRHHSESLTLPVE